MKIIGVLAMQGDFIEHVRVLRSLKVMTREVRTSHDLKSLDGLIIPDYNLELENVDHFEKFTHKYNQILIRFIALESTRERMKFLSKGALGFVYCFSTQGITGLKSKIDAYLIRHLKQVRRYFSLPLAVGFGISNKDDIYALKGKADIIVVGSAMIKVFEKGGLENARTIVRELVSACK